MSVRIHAVINIGKLAIGVSCALAAALGMSAAQSTKSFNDGDDAANFADPKGTFTFIWENDSFASTDRNYTNGIRLSYISGQQATDGFSEFVAHGILRANEDATIRRGFAVGHSIFTPEDIEATEFLPDQHPYAGFLYGETTAIIERGPDRTRGIDQLTVQLGVIGPSAGGEWVQNEFHSLIGIEGANGWDNQLEDEPALVISYDRKLSKVADLAGNYLMADLSPNVGFSVGNVYNQARAGLTARIGENLRSDYGPPRVRPSLGGAGYFVPQQGFSWYVFAGAEARLVGYNIFLDGSLINDDEIDLTRNEVVGDYQFGAVIKYGGNQMTLTVVQRSKEFEEQSEEQRFGAFTISRKF